MGATLVMDQRSLLKQARVAEDDGRYLDAIDLLRAALAVDRSSRLDRRLLHVRNKAFDEREVSVGRAAGPSWPASVAPRRPPLPAAPRRSPFLPGLVQDGVHPCRPAR